MTEPAIVVRNMHKSYGSHEAVRGIDLEVESGEVFGFLGPNGAGKTTTIEILEGYRPRTSGDITVLGVDPDHPTAAWRDRIGLVLQECEFDPLLTVRETVGLFRTFFSRPRPVDEVIELVGLKEKANARLGTLSGGQRRRADVAVAIVGGPDLIFLDEPTTGFDPSARRDAWNMIEGLKALGTTIFLTTHYMDEAEHLADRVAILSGGKIVSLGRPGELGGEEAKRTHITFRVPAGFDAEPLRAALGSAVDLSGAVASLDTDDAQRTLYQLTGWAETNGVQLEELQARRANLEDVFLQLTGGDHHA